MRSRDLSGEVFGRLTVLGATAERRNSQVVWACSCKCGASVHVPTGLLQSGKTKSCGCFRKDKGTLLGRASRRHGEGMNGKESAEYRAWSQMLSRCNNVNHIQYPAYGGRGISVCERWHTYEHFLADMGRRPSDKHSIDRIKNDLNYTADNCRWATSIVQNNNRRGNRYVTVFGVRKSLADWLREAPVTREMFYRRVNRGWTPQAALFMPTGTH